MPYTKPTSFNYNIVSSWYKTPAVKFELIKSLYNREFALLVPRMYDKLSYRSVRTLKVHSVQHLDFNLKATDMFKFNTPYNFYYSLAKFKNGIPNQTLNFQERNNDDWKENYYKEMVSYDWLIDIDAGDFDDLKFAYHSARNVKGLFDKLNVPYELRYSGMGFHFIVPYKFLPKNLTFNPHSEELTIYKFLKNLTKCIADDYSDLIDLNVFDSRRVCKLPYSLAIYENDAFVCHPFLSDEEFKNFKVKGVVMYGSLYKLRPENYKYQVQNRGTRLFNSDGNISKLLMRYKLNEYIKHIGGDY